MYPVDFEMISIVHVVMEKWPRLQLPTLVVASHAKTACPVDSVDRDLTMDRPDNKVEQKYTVMT